MKLHSKSGMFYGVSPVVQGFKFQNNADGLYQWLHDSRDQSRAYNTHILTQVNGSSVEICITPDGDQLKLGDWIILDNEGEITILTDAIVKACYEQA